jgi:ATP-dependent Lhr-like helicase
VKSEGVAGGFAAVYPVLRALEDSGKIRRGWFVATLGAAQFALGGAVERLRSEREPSEAPRALVLAATDPAQPYGAALAWPESSGRPQRAAGTYVVIVDGAATAYVERSGRGLLTFANNAADRARETGSDGQSGDAIWIEAIVAAHKEGRLGPLQLQRIDDGPARQSPLAPALRAAGFVDGYRGLTLRS